MGERVKKEKVEECPEEVKEFLKELKSVLGAINGRLLNTTIEILTVEQHERFFRRESLKDLFKDLERELSSINENSINERLLDAICKKLTVERLESPFIMRQKLNNIKNLVTVIARIHKLIREIELYL